MAFAAKGKNKKFKKGGNPGGHKEKGKTKKGEKDLSKVVVGLARSRGTMQLLVQRGRKGRGRMW